MYLNFFSIIGFVTSSRGASFCFDGTSKGIAKDNLTLLPNDNNFNDVSLGVLCVCGWVGACVCVLVVMHHLLI